MSVLRYWKGILYMKKYYFFSFLSLLSTNAHLTYTMSARVMQGPPAGVRIAQEPDSLEDFYQGLPQGVRIAQEPDSLEDFYRDLCHRHGDYNHRFPEGVKIANEPDSLENLGQRNLETTFCPLQALTFATSLEHSLEDIGVTPKHVLVSQTIQGLNRLGKPLQNVLKYLFLERCSQKIFFDGEHYIQTQDVPSYITVKTVTFLGTQFKVTYSKGKDLKTRPDKNNSKVVNYWHSLSWHDLIERYCTILMAKRNGDHYPYTFKSNN